MKAKEITGCEVCPLKDEICSGGWSSGGGGEPIEPPCCSWDPEDEIEDNGYLDNFNEQIECMNAFSERIENEKRKEEQKRYKQARKYELQKIVASKTSNGITKCEPGIGNSYKWFCKRCNKWVYPYSERWSGGVGEAMCPKCCDTLICCSELEKLNSF